MVGMSPALYSTAQPQPRRQSVCTQSLASRLYLTLLVTTIPRIPRRARYTDHSAELMISIISRAHTRMGYHPEAPQPEIIFNISHLCCYQLHTILIAHLEKHIRLHLTPAYLSARVCHDRIRNKGYE